ncbi:hypothetical protein ACLOJK_012815 [Asimina triloba]
MTEGKSVKSKVKHPKIPNGQNHDSPLKLSRFLDPEASWDKDQLGDVLHWIRQVVALTFGLIWGVIPVVGAIWIVVFLVLSSGIIYGYYSLILKIDEEDFGGHGALLQEGLFASFSLFLFKYSSYAMLAHLAAYVPLGYASCVTRKPFF